MNTPKTKQIHIRVDPVEHRICRDLCEEYGLGASDLVRQLLRREYAEMQRRQTKSILPRAA